MAIKKQKLEISDIEEYIPHRFENMLIDNFEIKDNLGKLWLTIREDDIYGRDIFLKKVNNKSLLMDVITMEILALGSIISTGKIPENHIAFFASIIRYKKYSSIKAGQKIIGNICLEKSKAGFFKSKGELVSDSGEKFAEGNLMAYVADVSNGMPESEKNFINLPKSNINIDLKKFNFSKQESMFLADKLLYQDETSCMAQYFFPSNHSLTKGHFPGNAVFMGVLQWAMLEDVIFCYFKYNKTTLDTEEFKVICNANICRTDGSVVTGIKESVIFLHLNSDDQKSYSEILETKRVAFRDIVYPDQQLMIYVTNIQKI